MQNGLLREIRNIILVLFLCDLRKGQHVTVRQSKPHQDHSQAQKA